MPTDRIPARRIITQWHKAMRANPDLVHDVRDAHVNYLGLLADMDDRRQQLYKRWVALGGDPGQFDAAMRALGYFSHGSDAIKLLRGTLPLPAYEEVVPGVLPGVQDAALVAYVVAGSEYQQALKERQRQLVGWLLDRYREMWRGAPSLAPGPRYRAVERALRSGAWAAALEPLLAAVPSSEAVGEQRITASFFADGRRISPPWLPPRLPSQPGDVPAVTWQEAGTSLGPGDWSDYAGLTADMVPDHVTVAIHVPLLAADDLEQATAVLQQVWLKHVQGRTTALQGSHGKGDLPDWANRVTLYRLWRRYEQMCVANGRPARKAAFARAASERTLPIWRVLERLGRKTPVRLSWLAGMAPHSIETKLIEVIRQFGPDPRVPPLGRYLANQ